MSTYYITVFGNGSFSLGRGPIWRGPDSHEITDAQAEQCLRYKEETGSENFVISTTKPEVEQADKPAWMLRPQDLAWHRREATSDEFDRASPDDDYSAAPDEFPCDHCAAVFTSDAGLEQHTALKHSRVHEQMEDEVRERLAAEKEARAAQERVSRSSDDDPKSVRPEERPDDDVLSPVPPRLWPQNMPGGSG